MKSILAFLLLTAATAQSAVVLTDTNVLFLQRNALGRHDDVNILGSASLWEAVGFNGTGRMQSLSLWDMTTLIPGRAPLYVLRVNAAGDGLEFVESATGSGSGNVEGPASAVDGNFAVFDGVTGAVVKDAATSPSGLLATAAAAAAAALQPKDQDLLDIAALSTTAFGRGLLDDANAAAARTSLGLVIGTDVLAYSSQVSLLGPSIALSEMGSIATGTVLGRYSSGTGNPEVLTWGPDFTITGGTVELAEEYQPSHERLQQLVDGALDFQLLLDEGYIVGGRVRRPLPALVGTTMNLELPGETYSATSDATLSFSGGGLDGDVYVLKIDADGTARTTDFPESYSPEVPGLVHQVTTPADGITYLTFLYNGTSWEVLGIPPTTSGTGSYTLQNSATHNNPVFTGNPTMEDGKTWTFNPNGTEAGISVGTHSSDPSSPDEGTIWGNTATNTMKYRIGGVTYTFGVGGGLAADDIDASSEIRAIFDTETGTGDPVFSEAPTINDANLTGTVDAVSVEADSLVTESYIEEPAAMGALAVDVARVANTKTFSADATITFTGTPTAGQYWGLIGKNSSGSQITITLPASIKDAATGSAVTSYTIAASGQRHVIFRYDGTDNLIYQGGGTGSSGLASTDIDTSAELRAILTDESGTGAAIFAGGDIGAATATTASAGDNDTSTATTAFVQTEVDGTRTSTHASPYTTASATSPTWNGPFHAVYMGVAQTVNLPAASGYDGRGIMVYNTGSFTLTVEPNGSEVIVRDGTVQTGGVNFTLSSGAGNYVSLISDGTRWITLGYKGTLSVGS